MQFVGMIIGSNTPRGISGSSRSVSESALSPRSDEMLRVLEGGDGDSDAVSSCMGSSESPDPSTKLAGAKDESSTRSRSSCICM
jgi:hypothetical protein